MHATQAASGGSIIHGVAGVCPGIAQDKTYLECHVSSLDYRGPCVGRGGLKKKLELGPPCYEVKKYTKRRNHMSVTYNPHTPFQTLGQLPWRESVFFGRSYTASTTTRCAGGFTWTSEVLKSTYALIRRGQDGWQVSADAAAISTTYTLNIFFSILLFGLFGACFGHSRVYCYHLFWSTLFPKGRLTLGRTSTHFKHDTITDASKPWNDMYRRIGVDGVSGWMTFCKRREKFRQRLADIIQLVL